MLTVSTTRRFTGLTVDPVPGRGRRYRVDAYRVRAEWTFLDDVTTDPLWVEAQAAREAELRQWLARYLDHRVLADAVDFPITLPHLAAYIGLVLADHPGLASIRVADCDGRTATWTPDASNVG